jgi:hypothetical protein
MKHDLEMRPSRGLRPSSGVTMVKSVLACSPLGESEKRSGAFRAAFGPPQGDVDNLYSASMTAQSRDSFFRALQVA